MLKNFNKNISYRTFLAHTFAAIRKMASLKNLAVLEGKIKNFIP